ncbi:MFS transporter [Pseudactinotalea sp. Z1748]|uniref:MFS transporter n=1 Tax=Pseudactinotalea sp. Z1748 TaxID=3413027 RepID=UPI003C7AA589
MSISRRLYEAVMTRDVQAEANLDEQVRRDVPYNAVRLVGAHALQSSGDQTVNASTVLPWLFQALGVPPALTGLLVPIRESGSMLPQAALTPVVLRVRRRVWVFVTGALIQAVAVAAMALVAATGSGLGAGVAILAALAVFSFGRSLGSMSSKDVQGRTLPKGQRGQINGLSTTAAGVVAITLGVALRAIGGGDLSATQIAWLLGAGAVMWVLTAVVYAGIREPVDDESHARQPDTRPGAAREEAETPWWRASVQLLRDDAPFRRFVIVRSLLLVSALSPPFLVSLAAQSGAGAISGLGGFVIASGLSALLGGPVAGRLADRSSRTLMAVGAGVASAVLLLIVVLTLLPGFDGDSAWGAVLFVGSYFALTLIHTGVRVGRKTYLVDMAEGDQRTKYVAVSNTAMGIILLIAGALSSALSVLGVHWALVFLAVLGVLGVVAARRLPEVSVG